MTDHLAQPSPEARWFTFGDRAMTHLLWAGRKVEIYRSRTGRSFRIWVDGVEWKKAVS